MVNQNIPFEIWLNIARFIPPDELQFLLEYREEIFRNVHMLKDNTFAAQRARILRLWPQIIPTLSSSHRYLPRRTRYKNIITRVIKREPSPSAQAMSNMLQVLSGLKNLTDLDLIRCQHCLDLPDLITFLPVVNMGWVTFGHNLQRLALDITLEGCEYILSPSLTFPRLEKLVFALSQAYRTTDSRKIMKNILVPFINRHCLTLNSLEFSSYDYLDLCGMLGALQHFPHLRRLKLDFWFASPQQTCTAGLQHALELHTDSLQDLNLNFTVVKHYSFAPPPAQWFQQKFLRVPLPNLQSLELGMTDLVVDADRTAGYLKQYKNTIKTLVLQSQPFSLHEVDVIVSLFTKTDSLRTLNISVIEFCPALLDLLSTKLPSLRRLEVEFDYFSPGLEGIDPPHISLGASGPYSQFCNVMDGRSYPSWKIRYLNVIPSDYIVGDVSGCRDVIKKAIPSLDNVTIGYKDIMKGFMRF
ncbi:hypothetical protein BDZ94DRAFT_143841 [Collybia nuda]|uniref:Uncharacterized protein n=1 Tax=Collybia nuda TaxID=64659 RepID=A0A9P5XWP0_9AGAR|nr:hypothetical protein BDZ94DRAFT_143841 [Collybia nuda]